MEQTWIFLLSRILISLLDTAASARATGRPKATLSRRVSELESGLDLRLFERGARNLKLTEEARALFERAGALLAELDETVSAIASGGHTPKGK